MNRLITRICFLLVVLYVFATGAQAQVLQRCGIVDGVTNNNVVNKEFDLSRAIQGHELELCQFESNISLSRVSRIRSINSVSYVVLQFMCRGERPEGYRDTPFAKDLSSIRVNCKFEDRHTRMCLETKSDCSTYYRDNFVMTSNVRVSEFEAILDFVQHFRLNRIVKLEKNVLPEKMSLKALKWIFESKDEPKILSIVFEDYSSTQIANAGKFRVVARQGRELWSAIIAPNAKGFSLISVGVMNQ